MTGEPGEAESDLISDLGSFVLDHCPTTVLCPPTPQSLRGIGVHRTPVDTPMRLGVYSPSG